MTSPSDVLVLIEKIRCITSEAEHHSLVEGLARVEHPTIVSFINAHALNLCRDDEQVLAGFRASDVLLRDGIGIKLAMRMLGREPGRNMNGTDFIPHLLGALPRRRLAIYGTASPWLEQARHTLAMTTPHRVVDTQHGFFPTPHYRERSLHHRPDIILLAMGMPRQEEVAADIKRHASHPVLILNGGAIVDFMAGRFQRAPTLVQRFGMEWLFRMAQEPRRLGRRYVSGGIRFGRNLLTLRRAAGHSRPALMHKEL
jgi:exopolysaccharide biosynthesis WecB/TagA/CpsF family protein